MAWLAVTLGTTVAFLDGLDGYLARRSDQASEFGARFDMETDAALILVLAILAWQYDKAGVWVVLSGLLRYLFIAAGWWWAWMRAPLPSSFRGKLICVIQIVVLIVVLVPGVTPPLSVVLSAAGLAALGYASGPTVGAFALGLFTRTANTTGVMIGMLSGLLGSLALGLLSPQVFGVPGVAWTWNVFVGAILTFIVGIAASSITREPQASRGLLSANPGQ